MTNKQAIGWLSLATPLKAVTYEEFSDFNEAIDKAIKALSEQEPKTGHWILVKGSNGKDYHKCSNCLHTQDITGVKNYCAVCGADMTEVEHEQM